MSEDPIKVFWKRSELYPNRTKPIWSKAVPAPRRVAEGTADGLDQLEQRFEGFKVEKLAGNEVFVSAAILTRAAAANHLSQKRAALRNALLNTARDRGANQMQMFFRYIDELTARRTAG